MRQKTTFVSPTSNKGRNTYVVEHLTDTLLMLLKEKTLADISISELINKAGVSRASFYRNFRSKEDILQKYIDAITEQFIKTKTLKYDSARFRDYTVILFEHLERNKALCILLLNNNLLYIIGDIFDKYFLKSAPDRPGQFKQMYLAGGFFNILKFWLIGGCRETPTELADMFIDFMGEYHIN